MWGLFPLPPWRVESIEYRVLITAGLAQMVEHLICNQGARGSIPLAGTTDSV
jgi:hypothetical protein